MPIITVFSLFLGYRLFCRVLWVDVMVKCVDSEGRPLGLNPSLSLLQENKGSDEITQMIVLRDKQVKTIKCL